MYRDEFMKNLIHFLGLGLFLACSSVIASPQLPMPTGPYQVGFTKFDLHDPFRKEIEHPSGRPVPIQVYFPVQQGSHSLHQKVYEIRAPKEWSQLETEVYSISSDLTYLSEEKHPLVFLCHGNNVAMTDYAFICEDLASHGYVVVSIQHQLETDPKEPSFWMHRSTKRYSEIINNLLFTFEWVKQNQGMLFANHIDVDHVAFIGHSMGANALLSLSQRTSSTFNNKQKMSLLPHDSYDAKECLILLDPGSFSFPYNADHPLFFLFAEEREDHQKKVGTHREMIKSGYKLRYYKGSKHISFMDHGAVSPQSGNDEPFFNGTDEERKGFYVQVRDDIREFLKNSGICPQTF